MAMLNNQRVCDFPADRTDGSFRHNFPGDLLNFTIDSEISKRMVVEYE